MWDVIVVDAGPAGAVAVKRNLKENRGRWIFFARSFTERISRYLKDVLSS